MRKLLVILVAALAGFAHAGPAADAAAHYEVVQIKGQTCRAQYELGALRAQNGSTTAAEAYKEFLGCKNAVVNEAKATYSKVLGKLRTADGKKALKDYQVALMSYLEGIEPKNGETNGQYSGRMAALEGAMSSAWQRLQLEL